MNTTEIPTAITTVTVDAALLKAAMAKLKPAINKNMSAPALRCVRVDASATGVMLTATDLDVTLSTVVTGLVPADGSLLVPADVLNKVISVRPKGTIEVTGTGETGHVRSGNARIEFEPVDVDEFPTAKKFTGRRVDLSAAIIAELLPAMAKDGSRPILRSVYVGKGAYCTTDSFRLHVVNTGADLGDTFLIDGSAAEVMAKYKGTLACTVGENAIRVVLDATSTMHARLVDGEFPPFRRLIPENPPHRISFTDALTADLKDLVKLRLAGDTSTPVRITAANLDELELRRTGDYKPAVVTTPGTSTLDTVIAFAPAYLLDLIAGTTSNVLQVTDHLKPGLIREPAPELGDGAERVRLIMPVRVS